MKAEIINIGDELLIGQTLNTNGSWMGEQLDLLGIDVVRSISISDDKSEILFALEDCEKRADVVLITGGLGPTKDDITKHTLCEYFDTTLELNQEAYELIKSFFDQRNLEMLAVNTDQAMLPVSCDVLINKRGTASGMWFEKDGVVFISMPGVPYEMKYLMEFEVLPRLASVNQSNIYHQTVKTIGIGESFLAEKIKDWENDLLKDGLKLAYLPSPGLVKLRVLSYGYSEEENYQRVQQYIAKLEKRIPEFIFGYNKEELPEIIGALLLKNEKTIGVCESCTGGYVSHLFTSNSGCSSYYKGGVVTYTNESKSKLLNVNPVLFDTKGAVSEEVVKEMVQGGLAALEVDYCIAISGVAGPTGGTEEKPVGMVCVAVGSLSTIKTFTFQFGTNRENNIIQSATYGLNELRKLIIKNGE